MIFNPNNFLKLVFGRDFFKGKILNSEMELKKTMLQSIVKATTLSKREVNASVYKVVDFYNKKIETLKSEGIKSFKTQALNNEVLLKDRLENLVLWNEVQNLKKEHEGEFYRWLPSSAEMPDPEHQLLYGKIFKVGEGDKDGNMPSERYGCKCAMEILTSEEKEVLEKRISSDYIVEKQEEDKNVVELPDPKYNQKWLELAKEQYPERYAQAIEEITNYDRQHFKNELKLGGFVLEKSTNKAFLLKKDDKIFWIQKRWLKKDGTLTASGQKVFEKTITETEKKKNEELQKQLWKKGITPPLPDYETEKAIGYRFVLDFYQVERTRIYKMYFPKSVLQENGNIPTWIFQAKMKEMSESFPASMGEFNIDFNPFNKGIE